MLLENELIKLRPLEPEDLELLYRWENNPEIWSVSGTLAPFSKYILHQYIENSHRDLVESKQLRLIVDLKEKNNSFSIGTIDLFDIDFYHMRAGIGILIAHKNNRQKGYAEMVLDLLHEYCNTHLGMRQLYCHIDENNTPSLKLFKKKGYEISGTQKKWKKIKNEWKDVLFLQYFF